MNTQEVQPTASNQSLPGLLHQLTTQLSKLLRQELTLARTELFQSLTRLLSSVGAVLAGLAVLYVAMMLLLVAAIFGLALLMPIWLAALSLGVVMSGVGFILVQRGRRLLKGSDLAPTHSSQSLRKDTDVLLRRARQ
jgi:ascorbate-specific PTS system EIIC-type component UlaA